MVTAWSQWSVGYCRNAVWISARRSAGVQRRVGLVSTISTQIDWQWLGSLGIPGFRSRLFVDNRQISAQLEFYKANSTAEQTVYKVADKDKPDAEKRTESKKSVWRQSDGDSSTCIQLIGSTERPRHSRIIFITSPNSSSSSSNPPAHCETEWRTDWSWLMDRPTGTGRQPWQPAGPYQSCTDSKNFGPMSGRNASKWCADRRECETMQVVSGWRLFAKPAFICHADYPHSGSGWLAVKNHTMYM